MLIADASNDAIASLFSRIVEDSGVAHVLRMVRKHLGMDVAFVSHFRADDRIFEEVDSDGPAPIHAGQAISLEEGYCLKVVRGELPQLIPDTSCLPEALALPATRAIPIGSHLSVPIQLEGGEVYGTLCCFSYLPDVTLGERDMGMMRAFAEVLAARIDEDLARVRSRERAVEDIRAVMAAGAPRIVFQPIYRLDDEGLAGVECLARFDHEPVRPPDHWFNAAHEAGIGLDLELHAIHNALAALDRFPQPVSLGLNSSADLILSGRLAPLLGDVDLSRIMIEITEHTTVTDYDALARALQPLRDLGAGLAIDDAGAGYASMRHILNLKSDVIKLDMSLTRDIDSDPSRRALARGLISFAHDIGSSITAEGVETRAELDVLRSLGVDKVQGYFLSRPLALEAALGRDAVGVPGLRGGARPGLGRRLIAGGLPKAPALILVKLLEFPNTRMSNCDRSKMRFHNQAPSIEHRDASYEVTARTLWMMAAMTILSATTSLATGCEDQRTSSSLAGTSPASDGTGRHTLESLVSNTCLYLEQNASYHRLEIHVGLRISGASETPSFWNHQGSWLINLSCGFGHPSDPIYDCHGAWLRLDSLLKYGELREGPAPLSDDWNLLGFQVVERVGSIVLLGADKSERESSMVARINVDLSQGHISFFLVDSRNGKILTEERGETRCKVVGWPPSAPPERWNSTTP